LRKILRVLSPKIACKSKVYSSHLSITCRLKDKHNQKRTCRRVVFNHNSIYEEGFNQEDYEKALNAREWIAYNCEWLVIEPGLQEIVYKKYSNKEGKWPFLCTCGWLKYPEQISSSLDRFSLVVLGVDNAKELEYYREQIIKDENISVDNCILTDGSSIVAHLDQAKKVNDFPLLPNQVFNVKRRIPFLLAGILYSLSLGYPVRQAIRIGVGFATSDETNIDNLT